MRSGLFLKVVIFTLLVPGTVTFYVPRLLLSRVAGSIAWPPLSLAIPALLLGVAGAVLYFRCVWDFAVRGSGTPAPIDPPRNLVVTGFYRWTRNPMYQGVVLLLLAEALFFRSGALLVYGVCVALVLHGVVVGYEERVLRKQFGPGFDAYFRAVPRWGLGGHSQGVDGNEPGG